MYCRTARPTALALLAGAFCLLLAATPVSARAQYCFRGKPVPQCATFWLTEVGFNIGTRRAFTSPRGEPTGHLLTWELGWMRNLGGHVAVGGSSFIEGDGFRMAGWRVGVKARYRRWLEEGRSLDVGPGVILYGEENFTPGNPGALVAVGYNIGDVISFTGQVEALQYPDRNLQVAGYVGVRLGSYPGLLTALVALVAAAVSIPPVTAAF